ncbi:hypothetical protein [Streptomyces sp. CS62]|uniref:hypothetical protein n=1 Tax=Streptomyces sp. CS62 TaxID=3119268 RepID=UPI002F9380E1
MLEPVGVDGGRGVTQLRGADHRAQGLGEVLRQAPLCERGEHLRGRHVARDLVEEALGGRHAAAHPGRRGRLQSEQPQLVPGVRVQDAPYGDLAVVVPRAAARLPVAGDGVAAERHGRALLAAPEAAADLQAGPDPVETVPDGGQARGVRGLPHSRSVYEQH